MNVSENIHQGLKVVNTIQALRNYLLFMFMCAFYACESMFHMYAVPAKDRRGHRILENCSSDGYKNSCGYWELNPVSLQEQAVLFSAELSFQPQALRIYRKSMIFRLEKGRPNLACGRQFLFTYCLQFRKIISQKSMRYVLMYF